MRDQTGKKASTVSAVVRCATLHGLQCCTAELGLGTSGECSHSAFDGCLSGSWSGSGDRASLVDKARKGTHTALPPVQPARFRACPLKPTVRAAFIVPWRQASQNAWTSPLSCMRCLAPCQCPCASSLSRLHSPQVFRTSSSLTPPHNLPPSFSPISPGLALFCCMPTTITAGISLARVFALHRTALLHSVVPSLLCTALCYLACV